MTRHVATLVVAALLLLGAPAATLAYSPSQAASYADANYNRHPPGGSSGCGTEMAECYADLDNDCANFVSAALHEAGYDFHGTGSAAATIVDERKWFARWSSLYGPIQTLSWAYAHGLYRFLLLDSPGGSVKAIYSGDTRRLTSQGVKGSVIFYDWDGISEQRPIDHVSIQVGHGYDSTDRNWYGDLVDQQNNDRWHVIWHRRPANQDWATTRIYVVNVDTGN